jgi:hypothetical protein
VNGRFPTYNLVTGNYSQKEKRIPAGRACLLVRKACEGGGHWQRNTLE